VIVLDTETEPFGPANQAPRLVVLTVCGAEGAELVHHSEAEPWVRALLEGDWPIVGHHVAYDMAVLLAAYPHLGPALFAKYDRDQVTDTGIRQKLIDLAAGTRRQGKYSLAALAQRLLGVELSKGDDTWRTRYGELRDVPVAQWPAAARDYAELDVVVTAHVYAAQSPHPDEFRQARAALWLQLMSCWGLTTDPVAVAAFADEAQRDYDLLVTDLVACGLMKPGRVTRNGKVIAPSRDTKAAMARMVAAGSTSKTATGRVALDDAACQDSGDPLLAKYGQASAAAKVLSTDVPLVQRGLIHARFEPLLETGRTASSPNIMNMPRQGAMRSCFVPRPGHLFVCADYSQMELRTLAQVCMAWLGKSKLAEALNAGKDPHCEVASVILGTTYEDALARKKEPEVDTARQVGKVANFGFPGGLGATRLVHFAKLSYGVTMTEGEARQLKARWLRAWPEMRDYFDRINACNGRVEQLYSGRWRGGVSYCEACNSPFQGLAADAAKAAGWTIARACYTEPDSVLFDSRPVLFCHDEFLLESPIAIAHECALELARLMQVGAAPWLPDCPPVVGAPVVARRYAKAMQPVYDEHGRLVPWDVAKS
jgi:hypothetical protein